jgi:hypothetical protein
MRVFHVMLKGALPLFWLRHEFERSTCSGIADDATDDIIVEHFAKVGPILKVKGAPILLLLGQRTLDISLHFRFGARLRLRLYSLNLLPRVRLGKR